MRGDRLLALTGPAAAAVYNLEGFRGLSWPVKWCAPASSDPAPDVIRTRRWTTPRVVLDQVVAQPDLVIRHLNAIDLAKYPQPDGVAPRDRIELALEHALRTGLVSLSSLTFTGGPQVGSNILYHLLRERSNEPPTGSFPETLCVQLLRSQGITPWRQVKLFEAGVIVFRADFVIPFRRMKRRPKIIRPEHGFILEVDSKEFHGDTLERDRSRDLTYQRMGYRVVIVTPSMIEHKPNLVIEAVERELGTHLTSKAS